MVELKWMNSNCTLANVILFTFVVEVARLQIVSIEENIINESHL